MYYCHDVSMVLSAQIIPYSWLHDRSGIVASHQKGTMGYGCHGLVPGNHMHWTSLICCVLKYVAVAQLHPKEWSKQKNSNLLQKVGVFGWPSLQGSIIQGPSAEVVNSSRGSFPCAHNLIRVYYYHGASAAHQDSQRQGHVVLTAASQASNCYCVSLST